MMALSASSQEEWDEKLLFLSMAYMSTPHAASQLSPDYVMFGREINMPIDVVLGSLNDETSQDLCDYVQNLHDRIVWENLQVAAERNSAFVKTHGKPFCESDLCWVAEKRRKKGECPKLKPKWRGPFLVRRILNDVLMEVQISGRKSCVYHTDLLKHCFSNDLPVWLTRMRRSLQAKEGKV
jgi:hypothetical protein